MSIAHLEKKSEKIFEHISYKEKIDRSLEELSNTVDENIVKRGWKERDETFGGIFGGQLYLVGGETGMGKSTFMNQLLDNIAGAGTRCVRYSLEDRMEEKGKEDLFYMVNRFRRADNKEPYKRVDFVCNRIQTDEYNDYMNRAYTVLIQKKVVELDKKKQVTIDDLVKLMEEEAEKGTRVFAIDHLHYFEFDDSGRLDLQIKNVMHKLNEIARKHNVSIFLIAHYKSSTGEVYENKPSPTYFKDGSALKQVANVIIQIQRNYELREDPTLFWITKLRGPIKVEFFSSHFNMRYFEYDFEKTEEQIKKEALS